MQTKDSVTFVKAIEMWKTLLLVCYQCKRRTLHSNYTSRSR